MRIAILDFHSLAGDSRVLRTAETLHRAGHDVLLVGYGPVPRDVEYRIHILPDPPSPFRVRAGILLRQAPANLLPASAEPLYWCHAARRHARDVLRSFRPEAVHANDWNTLPLAVDAKRHCDAQIVYDTHEMAVAEYEHSLKWRLAALAHVRTIEGRGIRFADAVIAVSPGIVRALRDIYPDAPPAQLIRNVPNARPAAFRPTGERIEVLYHGLLRDNRGLEATIDSVPLWREEFSLTLRGAASPGYRARLEALAARNGVAHRIRFEPPVDPSAVVASAATADIGLCLLPDSSRHNRFALPNKLFEYLTAGLAVMVSDVPDMAELVRRHGCGLVIPTSPSEIADAVNALDRSALDRMKKASLAAAADLSWDKEREILIGVYEALARRTEA